MGIKKLRKKKGLSQKELADKMAVDQTAISQWERGVSYPRVAKLQELAKVLECTIDELVMEE